MSSWPSVRIANVTKVLNWLNNNEEVKIAAAAMYLPITMSKSSAGKVSSNSSVP